MPVGPRVTGNELEEQEAAIAAIEDAEAIPTRLDVERWQVLPLTSIVLPKNSGFQIGDTSLSGTYGPRNSSKYARLGKRSHRS